VLNEMLNYVSISVDADRMCENEGTIPDDELDSHFQRKREALCL
jgi:hypothetical protein